MIIQYDLNAAPQDIQTVRQRIEGWGLRIKTNPGQKDNSVIVDNVFGNVSDSHRSEIRQMSGVKQVIPIEGVPQNMALAHSRTREALSIPGYDFKIGADEPLVVMGGVCAVDKDYTLPSHQMAKRAGVKINRGGAYKPRTSPYDFQGLKEDGLKVLHDVRQEVGLPIVSEILDVRDLDLFLKYDIDILQIGTRNAQNFELLIEVGRTKKPVLYKRGFSNSIDETLKAANYIMEQGNQSLMICLRGVKGIGHSMRNQADLDEIITLRRKIVLPIVFDVSHSSGNRQSVQSMGNMAAAGGADGILLDVHSNPKHALVDGFQAISDEAELASMIKIWTELRQITMNHR